MQVNCKDCTLGGISVECYIPANSQYPVLWVGQAPGKVELITGVPFTGGAGKMLYSMMKDVGLNKTKFSFTNVVMCKPPGDGMGNDRVPTPHEIVCCRPHLIKEIWEIEPQLIVALGGPAMKELTGEEGIMSNHGRFFSLLPLFSYEAPVLALFHPSFVMRTRQWIPVAVKDLNLVHTFFSTGLPKEIQYNFLLDPDEESLREYIYKDKVEITAFDTETTGLNPRLDQVIGMSFSNSKDTAVAIYLVPDDPRLDIVRDFLEDEDKKKVAQNGSFDIEFLRSLHIEVKGLDADTRLAELLLNSDMPKNLDHLRAVYTTIKGYKPKGADRGAVHKWSKERMLEYACWDAVCTLQVWQKQKSLLTEKQDWLMHSLLLPIIYLLNKMERKGIKINIPTLALMYQDIVEEADILEKEIKETLDINPASPKQITDLLGLSSSDRDTLTYQIKRGHPQAEEMKKIIRFRDLTKGGSTFLKGVYKRREGDHIHTEYNLGGTGTGRLSSSNPNLQNIQRPFRVIYEAELGHVLVSLDAKQLELWIGALLSQCPRLLDDLRNKVDVHGRIQELIRPYLPERLKISERYMAKAVVFGTFYGRSARSIAIEFGVSIEMAKSWQDACINQYPGLKVYLKDREKDVRERGYVETLYGRKRFLQTVTQAYNTPVQSTAADLILEKMLELDAAGLDIRLNVHDEIVFQSPISSYLEEARLAKKIFETPVPLLYNNSFPCSLKVGENWYEMEDIEL